MVIPFSAQLDLLLVTNLLDRTIAGHRDIHPLVVCDRSGDRGCGQTIARHTEHLEQFEAVELIGLWAGQVDEVGSSSAGS